MGSGRWNAKLYTKYTDAVKNKPRALVYGRTHANAPVKAKQAINIQDIAFRESRDSEDNPNSTPVIIGLDVTGSMGFIPEALTKGALGSFMDRLGQHNVLTDPHLLFLGIGDATESRISHKQTIDSQPLQATQFEADNRICDQLTDLWLEGGGGRNAYESYDLAWAFAAYKTRTDAWDKRKTKGFLFTIGDEMFPKTTNMEYLRQIFKSDCPQDSDPASLLQEAQERYHVFHIIIAEGIFARRYPDKVDQSWGQQLGTRAITLSDHTVLAELLISAIALEQGSELDTVLDQWSPEVSQVLRKSLCME